MVPQCRLLSILASQRQHSSISRTAIKMNFFEDAVRFFSNMKKEASAKHILIKGPDAVSKLLIIKEELVGAEDLSQAFSDLAMKVNDDARCRSTITSYHLHILSPYYEWYFS